MLQFYFLSVLTNMLAGYALLVEDSEGSSALEGLRSYAKDEIVRLVLGILSVIVGFFKVLSAIRGDIPIIGDLIPAAAGILSGILLVYEYYKRHSTVAGEQPEKLEVLWQKKRWVGYGALVAGVAHFLFPTVLFL
ncbi:hypothetical protein [Treponema sp. J25]|uniref:hypothetical protein n=1 Tax=Treponema sp. J25 TaxID=2094121 RepID=UPI00104D261A|nr:hypothetical protein [Treponema sp. J25]TCW60764.1 hypothetical protein C5O22_09855 [Treponema sp. J25]